MAAVKPRWLWQNFVQLGGTLIFVTSEQIAHPSLWLRDPLASKRWRSELGWTIVANYNDRFDYREGASDKAAALTPGVYTTGADLAAELTTAMNAVATSNTYLVTYDSVTFKFTVARATGSANLTLEHNSGTNKSRSVSLDLGYRVLTDDTGSTSYLADDVAYQSRQRIWFDFGLAFGVRAAILQDSNLNDGTDTITIVANTTESFTTPPFSETLTWGVPPRISKGIFAKQFTEVSYRWWAFEIHAVQNPIGFVEVGVPYVGSYSEPAIGYHRNYGEGREELSEVEFADQGAQFQNARATRNTWNVAWPGLSLSDKKSLDAILDFVKVGRPFFFSLDSRTLDTELVYVSLLNAVPISSVSGDYWAVSLELSEVLP